jgi:hypothetical protein
VSRIFRLYYAYLITLISFVLFTTNGLISAQLNVTSPNILNITSPNTLPNVTSPNTRPTISSPDASSSITEAVNEVLSGSIDGMIGETVNMLTSDTANISKDSIQSSFENELPSSLTLDKNKSNITQNEPIEPKIQGNLSNNTLNISKQIQANNETASDSVNKIKQSFQKSMYNSTIVQSFDNNSFTNLVNQNTFDEFLYKMKNILDIDLFK